MESEIAEILLYSAVGCALPYALAATADWIKRHRRVRHVGANAPNL